MPRNEHRVFPFYNLYMQKIHPSQECPFHPQEESGATWLIDMTSPETENAIWLKGKNEWKLLSQYTAKVLCHMKLILWGQQLESGYSPYIILPANYMTQYLFQWARCPAMTSKCGLGAEGREKPAREIATPFFYKQTCIPRPQLRQFPYLSKWEIRCVMLLPFQQNEASEITELFSKMHKMPEEAESVLSWEPGGEMVTKPPCVWERGGSQAGMEWLECCRYASLDFWRCISPQ